MAHLPVVFFENKTVGRPICNSMVQKSVPLHLQCARNTRPPASSLCHAVRADEAFGTGPKEAFTMTAIDSNNQKYLFLIRVDILRSRE